MQVPSLLLAASALFASHAVADDTYTITEPASGAVIASTQPAVIAWTSSDKANKLSFYLETADSKTHLYTIASDIYDSGSISWQPPANLTPAADYVIALLADGSDSEVYSSQFSITNTANNASSTFSPAAGQSVPAGSTIIIQWPFDNSVADVSISLMEGASTSSLKNISSVATGIANLGNVAYVVPGNTVSGSDYVFAIQDASGKASTIYTPKFTIVGTTSSSASPTTTGKATGTATTKATGTASGGSTGTTTSSSPSSTSSKSAASREAGSAVVGLFAAAVAYLAM
ncbi:hypothetical protein SBRCBS47491_001953 [Sporothrix bragantina]|uniref:Yeast cell wall synthesis Kre9/Knh1-like N-terminal domain-containing protein n=1 Tax=Sporothrix bragantina TaxID=671064 RepID=A0ABP0B2V5_9PEZI